MISCGCCLGYKHSTKIISTALVVRRALALRSRSAGVSVQMERSLSSGPDRFLKLRAPRPMCWSSGGSSVIQASRESSLGLLYRWEWAHYLLPPELQCSCSSTSRAWCQRSKSQGYNSKGTHINNAYLCCELLLRKQSANELNTSLLFPCYFRKQKQTGIFWLSIFNQVTCCFTQNIWIFEILKT